MRAAALAVLVGTSLGLVVVGADPAAMAAKKPPKPVISKIDPRSGPTTGGTKVTIRGKHLATAKAVLFGRTKGTKLTVKSDKKLTVMAPAHAAGVVPVTVKTKGGKSAKTPSARFTYVAEKPQVTSISPVSGPTTGGTRVTVNGTGFTGVTAVTFDGIPGTSVSVASPTQLQVTSPEHPARVAHVNVTNGVGTSPSKAADVFRYLPAPRAVTVPPPPGAAASPDAYLTGVSCPAEQRCWAVGGFDRLGGGGGALVETRTGASTWSSSEAPLPVGADLAQSASLADIDCASVSSCVAVGTYTATGPAVKPLVELWNGTSWAPQSLTMPADDANTFAGLVDVDCASATDCVAVGTYEENVGSSRRGLAVRWSSGTWSAVAIPAPAGTLITDVLAVDCPAPTTCVATGEITAPPADHLAAASLFNGTSWSVLATPPMPADAKPDPDAHFAAVSCASAATCTAIGDYFDTSIVRKGFVVTGLPGSWTLAAVPLPAGVDPSPGVRLNAISCTTSCAAVGQVTVLSGDRVPLLVRVGPGVSSELGTLPPSTTSAGGQETELSAIACLSATACIGAGTFKESDATARSPLVATLTNLTWSMTRGPLPAGATQGRPEAVATDGGVGIAVGDYVVGGVQQALIAVDLPLG